MTPSNEGYKPQGAVLPGAVSQSEVVISGLDTGPADNQRENLTPTEDRMRFQPTAHPAQEPEDEDG